MSEGITRIKKQNTKQERLKSEARKDGGVWEECALCERDSEWERPRQRHCGDERDAGFVIAGNQRAFLVPHVHPRSHLYCE